MGRYFAELCGTALAALAFIGAVAACDSENTCGVTCANGTQFTNDGTCACVPFDAGYCVKASDCPDAACPASDAEGTCGPGQLWSTTLCGCYPVVDGGLPKS